MEAIDIDAGALVRNITLTVHLRGLRRLKLRLWLAGLLIRLAVWVGGLGGVEFQDDSP